MRQIAVSSDISIYADHFILKFYRIFINLAHLRWYMAQCFQHSSIACEGQEARGHPGIYYVWIGRLFNIRCDVTGELCRISCWRAALWMFRNALWNMHDVVLKQMFRALSQDRTSPIGSFSLIISPWGTSSSFINRHHPTSSVYKSNFLWFFV
jgi:hypothetical protein